MHAKKHAASAAMAAGRWSLAFPAFGPERRGAPVTAFVRIADKPVKAATKSSASANFGMNMPLMSSAFDTAMWLNAA